MAKAYDLGESVLGTELLSKINGKLDESKAISDYRRKAEDITEDDLTPALRLQIQSGGGGTVVDPNGNVVAYDDTILRTRIVTLEADKMDKAGMTHYYKKDEIIHEANISPDYKSQVTHQINSANQDISQLQTAKADKTLLVGYRLKSDKISEVDLSQTLYNKILAGGGGGGVGVTLETVQLMIGDLDGKKADKNQLDLVRKVADPITLVDVDSSLKSALEDAVIAAAGLTGKADKSELTQFRKNADPIALVDMDADLSSKLSIALNAANDIEAFVVEYMGGVVQDITTDLNNSFGHQDQLDFPFQWEITMYHYPDNGGHYTVFWALNILYREIKQLIGRAADGGGAEVNGRVPALEGRMTTAESEITSLKTKTTSSENEANALKSRVDVAEGKVVALETKVETLESDVATLKSIIAALHPDIEASL